jgi:hypothetical protein
VSIFAAKGQCPLSLLEDYLLKFTVSEASDTGMVVMYVHAMCSRIPFKRLFGFHYFLT